MFRENAATLIFFRTADKYKVPSWSMILKKLAGRRQSFQEYISELRSKVFYCYILALFHGKNYFDFSAFICSAADTDDSSPRIYAFTNTQKTKMIRF